MKPNHCSYIGLIKVKHILSQVANFPLFHQFIFAFLYLRIFPGKNVALKIVILFYLNTLTVRCYIWPNWSTCHYTRNLVGSTEELERNRRNSAGIGTEPGCLYLHVPSTLALISLFGLPFLWAESHLKEGRWRSTIFLQFAIENFKCRSRKLIYD